MDLFIYLFLQKKLGKGAPGCNLETRGALESRIRRTDGKMSEEQRTRRRSRTTADSRSRSAEFLVCVCVRCFSSRFVAEKLFLCCTSVADLQAGKQHEFVALAHASCHTKPPRPRKHKHKHKLEKAHTCTAQRDCVQVRGKFVVSGHVPACR